MRGITSGTHYKYNIYVTDLNQFYIKLAHAVSHIIVNMGKATNNEQRHQSSKMSGDGWLEQERCQTENKLI